MYTPHKWQSREIIYAAQLNNLENGVQQNIDTLKEETDARVAADRNFNTRITGLEDVKHTHPNKAVIDSISQADIDYWNQGGGGGGGGDIVQLTQTLEAGNTTVVITAAILSSASRVDLYTSNGVAPLSQSIAGATYTAVFQEQEDDMEVMIEVRINGVDDSDN